MNQSPDKPTEEKAANPETGSQNKHPGKRKGFYIILIMVVALIFLSRQEPLETVDCTPQVLAGKPEVVMLGAWWCSYCYKAKKYFQKNDIHYCEYDMENTEEGRRLYERHGGGAVPVILIGQYRLNGFNEHQIETALERTKMERKKRDKAGTEKDRTRTTIKP
ncbi:MAG: hypothetical protein IMF14_05125 [Proteobacteria bacterium]|nr:hypothetical protein [Pseudomonadota bacterium]